jgi:hypothetical protein
MGDITESYQPPVDQLLTLGQPERHGTGVDYEKLGIGREQVAELIRMATDQGLNSAPSDSALVWAPVHAWWALAQLRVEEAIVPLLGLLSRIDANNDDWVGEEVPRVLAAIGPASLEPAAAYLADTSNDQWARIAAAKTLGFLGKSHPETRGACVARLTERLAQYAGQSEILNAALISPLLDLRAVESAPLMEQAFTAGRVDESVNGDWEDAAIELGLQTRREHPRKPNKFTRLGEQLRTALGYRLDADGQLVPSVSTESPVATRTERKTGRNEQCPCGSGRKFKKCCGP